VAGAILFTGLALCVPLGPMAIMTLVIYGLASASYTLSLKKIAILDVLILSSLFTLRLVFGIVVANVAASAWLLVLSLFLFTSLSLGKRYVETARAAAHGLSTLPGRGYVNSDAPFLMASGIATSMSAVLILVLYLIEEAFNAAIYSTPELLWLSPLILFWWLSRVWLLIGRNSIDDDPVTFALTDPASLLLGSAMLITFMGAWLY
jgi:4-hydroxybenzoate polyprenyltransferase